MTERPLKADSSSPLYKQLIRRLRGDIATGVYPVNARIPSEQELCDAYDVSRVTVRKALAELTAEGLLVRRQGKGTYVSVPRLCKDLRDVNSFHDACRMRGCVPGTQVIHARMVPAQREDVAAQLCRNGEQVVETLRLRLADGVPVMLETNHFPPEYDFLLRADLSRSLYATLQERDLEATQAVHEISLRYASPQQAALLQVQPGDALLCLEETIYDQFSRPLHTSVQLIRGDRFTFRI